MLESQSTSLGELSSLLGRKSHAAQTGLWVATLHYRALQRQQALLLHRSGWRPRCQISLSPPSLEDLRWWVLSSPHSRTCQDITLPLSTLPSGPMHLCWAGERPAMAGQPGDAGVWGRQNNTSMA